MAKVDCEENREGDGRDDAQQLVVVLVVSRDVHAGIIFERDGSYFGVERDAIWVTVANVLGHTVCDFMSTATGKSP